jgi:hypothetical protein
MGIQIAKSDYEAIYNFLKNASNVTEIECKIEAPIIKDGNVKTPGRQLNHIQFQRVLSYVHQAFYPRKLVKETVHLDVISKDARMTLEGMDNISYFCKNNKVIKKNIGDSVYVVEKSNQNKVTLRDYDISVKSATEVKSSDVSKQTILVNQVLKSDFQFFRIKNRYSIQMSEQLRFDFTMVKSKKSNKELDLIKVFQSMKYDYEIELEVLNPHLISKTMYKQVILDMMSFMSEVLKVADDVDYIMSRSLTQDVLSSYVQLCYNMNLSSVNFKSPKRFFIGPQPTNIEKKHLLASDEYPINIHAGYTVTLKADGERHLLFCHNDGEMYLINSRLQVHKIGVNIPHYALSIFDCELIKNSMGNTILIFDVYFIKGKMKANLPLVPLKKEDNGRLKELDKFYHEVTNKNVKSLNDGLYELKPKEFYYPDFKQKGVTIYDNIQFAFHKIAAKDVEFHVDGIILTPMYLPVGVNFTLKTDIDILMLKRPIFGGSWLSVMKWKPPSENSIDFLITENEGPLITRDDGFSYKRFSLYCGKYFSPYDSSIAFIKNFKNEKWDDKKTHYYVKKQFDPASPLFDMNGVPVDVMHVYLKVNDMGHIKAENGDDIKTNYIVEFSFDLNKLEWKAMRVRVDKTEQYKMTNMIATTANDYFVALSIWKTIINPITRNMITGLETINKEDVTLDEPYYTETSESRKDTLTFPMKEFHNKWVKNHSLISKFKGHIRSLMDPTCGKGGDLNKYISASIPYVLGTDLSDGNIYNSKEGANFRLGSMMNQGKLPSTYKYVFIPMDFSQHISKTLRDIEGKTSKEKEDGDNDLLQILWDKKVTENEKLKRFQGFGAHGFEAINIQFALHYFFKSTSTLKACLDNIETQLKDGGFFIGTCFDGELIDNMFKNDNKDVIVGAKSRGTHDNNNKDLNIIWKIRKKYDKPFNPKDTLGATIGVFVETINDRENDEYLVGFDLLMKELRKRKIRLLTNDESKKLGLSREKSHGTFEELHQDMLIYKNSIDKEERLRVKWLDDASAMSADEKKLSFLYKWFIFKKDLSMSN